MSAPESTLTPSEALLLLLDHVDYSRGACGLLEHVGAVLPSIVIEQCREAIAASRREDARPMVDVAPPATARERWIYEQGRLAERDPRTPADGPIATIHVDGSFCHVEWHREAPNEIHLPVFERA